MGWVVKSESDIERVWVEIDANNRETGAASVEPITSRPPISLSDIPTQRFVPQLPFVKMAYWTVLGGAFDYGLFRLLKLVLPFL